MSHPIESGLELIEALRKTGTGEGKLSRLRLLLADHPDTTADDILAAIEGSDFPELTKTKARALRETGQYTPPPPPDPPPFEITPEMILETVEDLERAFEKLTSDATIEDLRNAFIDVGVRVFRAGTAAEPQQPIEATIAWGLLRNGSLLWEPRHYFGGMRAGFFPGNTPEAERHAETFGQYGRALDDCIRRIRSFSRKRIDAIREAAVRLVWQAMRPEAVPDSVETKAPPASGPERAETPNPKRGNKLPDAEMIIAAFFVQMPRGKIATITRDEIAATTKISAGQVSKTKAWKVFQGRRKGDRKASGKTQQLTPEMSAVIPNSCDDPAELAALIEQQALDQAQERRGNGSRHKPS